MKVSINWMKQFGGQGLDMPVDKLVEKIGAQLGAVEEVVQWGPRYDGIVVVKVVTCQKHPNADKLHVCLIDDGGVTKNVARTSSIQAPRADAFSSSERVAEGNVRRSTLIEQHSEEGGNAQQTDRVAGSASKQGGRSRSLVQVVCGAPNVKAGMLAAWIPPGVAVPNTLDKDPFILDARDIRGTSSNGMLASLHELGISDDHDGILEIRVEEVGKDLAKPGTAFKKLYGLDDYVIDIENKMFTHRPDCFGQLGVAREVAGISHKTFKSPDWYVKENSFASRTSTVIKGLAVENKIPKLCPRYMALAIEGVKVEPSPVWLQVGLARVGIRPINNIVDMTNWVMHMSGQPLHAFDFDKIAVNGRANIVIRNPKKGEKMTLLDGKEIEPRAEAILICDQDKPIAFGGVMGGNNSEIDANTKRIIIECANFDMYNIRKTSMEHGIFSEAVTRFNKGQSPRQCAPILYYAIQMVRELCVGSSSIGRPIDSYPHKKQNPSVAVSADFVNARLGTKLSLKDMSKLLENVEFKIKNVPAAKTRLHVQAPFWRTDIEIPEDIVEEIGRLYGYDHLPLALPVRNIKPAKRSEILDFKDKLRDMLAKVGANELLTYSFVHGNLFERVGQRPDDAFKLSNALSPDLQYYRLSLLPSLLEKVHINLKSDRVRGVDNEFALFEINPVHAKDFLDKEGLPLEDQRLALVFVADDKTAARKYQGAAYYAVRQYVDVILDQLGISAVFDPAKDHQPKLSISQAAIAPFDKSRTAIIRAKSGEFIGEIGEFSASTRRSLKLPEFIAGFELDVAQLLKLARGTSQYVALPRFPKVSQDITLKVPTSLAYGELYAFLLTHLADNRLENSYYHLDMPRIYQAVNDSDHKNVTLRLWMSHYTRTLRADEVNAILDQLAVAASTELQAERS